MELGNCSQNIDFNSELSVKKILHNFNGRNELTNITCFSDPYVRIDLNTVNSNETVDSVLTKTKKRVSRINRLV